MNTTKLFALALVISTAACGSNAGGAQPAADSAAGVNERVVNVEILEVTLEAFEDQVGITGTVEAERDVTVSAEESGVVRELFVPKGRTVRAGQPIARIDDSVLRAQHDQAVAEASLARETFERQRRLWEDEQIGSEMNYLRAKYGAETAEANARMLAARMQRTIVRAPISGVLETRMVEVGTMVAPGAAVARIIDVATLKVSGGVPERYAGEIRTGTAAGVMFDNLPGREFAGRTRFVGSAVSEQNRTFLVEVSVPNTGGMLKPGMVARVRLARGAAREATLVPREAVLRTESGYIVFVVRDRDGRLVAESVPVVTGSGSANRVVVESGLESGDRIVVVGQHQVTNGDVVRIVGGVSEGS